MNTHAQNRVRFDELLERMGGDRALALKVLEAFCAEAPTRLKTIDRRLAEGDREGLRRLAHTFKGSAATSGASFARVRALELEELALDGAEHEVREAIAGLRRETALVLTAISAIK